MNYYLAIDIGASSGRHILSHMENDKLVMEEIYRFENQMISSNGHLCWDIDHLVNEVKNGLKKCKELNKVPSTIGIDTWGVDYVLLDNEDNIIHPVYAYRDNRTQSVIKLVEDKISLNELYSITGIQKQPFNTIYQLYDDLLSGRLKNASNMLMIPDFLSFCLTGVKKQEYTNASTTSLLDAKNRSWSKEIINRLQLPSHLFKNLSFAGEEVGFFKKEIEEEIGFSAKVILVATHDTGSAVLAYPSSEDEIYLSSGTWSLIGVENKEPILTTNSKEANFTNEGGAYKNFRYLKNIMGSWMLQNIRKEYMQIINKKVTFPEMINLAKTSTFNEVVDVNDNIFLAPTSMIDAIKSIFPNKHLEIQDVLSVTYHSLANAYKNAIKEIEDITGRVFHKLYIFGGGCQDNYLNELTKKYTGLDVYAGPIEATAIGNILVQLIYDGVIQNIQEARQLVYKSFIVKEVK